MRRRLSALAAAALLAGCGSSGIQPTDGGADRADAPVLGPSDAASTGDATGGSDATDGAVTCAPACAAGQTCVEGACVPAPVVLARAPGCGAARLALAAGSLYWTERATGAVKRLALGAGATPTTIASGQMKPGPLTADDLALYWGNEGDQSLVKTPLAGADAGAADGGVTPLVTAPAAINGVLATGGAVYYSAGPSAWKIARTGGAPLTLATFATCKLSQPVALAQDGDYLYQTDVLSEFITRERVDGAQAVNNPCVAADAGAPKIAAPETISHSQGELYLDALYFSSGEVIWADHTTVYAKTPGAPAARGVALTASATPITGFVVTGDSVYLAEVGDPETGLPLDTIELAALGTPDSGADAPTAAIVAVAQPGASSFAADATHVYWTTHTPSATAGAADDCAIVSLAK